MLLKGIELSSVLPKNRYFSSIFFSLKVMDSKNSSVVLTNDSVPRRQVIYLAPVNIAVVKYWGKSNEELIIPLNDSISVTLSTEHLCAKTIIATNLESSEIIFSLNGKLEAPTKRFLRALELCREESLRQKSASSEDISRGLVIISENNFPTAAGLASSAAGFACLVSALKEFYKIDGDITGIVRQGSGSACRSIYGGFVRWFKGSNADGSDSIARQIQPASHWPELRILILVTNDQKKETSSTNGMRTSVETSELLKYRAEVIAPRRCEEMTSAITRKDFAKFAELTMKDSNQFHAVCLDTYPPIFYLNQVSHAVIDMVHTYNIYKGKPMLAYSFDAGANAFLFTLSSEINDVAGVIMAKFPGLVDFRGISIQPNNPTNELKDKLKNPLPDAVKYIIVTKAGEGATIVPE